MINKFISAPKVGLLLLAAALVSGCFPATRGELRETAKGRFEYEVADGYQSAYRKVVERMRHCAESTWIGDTVRVNADLYPDIRKGEIGIEGSNMLLGNRVELLIEIEDAGQGRSKVILLQPITDKQIYQPKRWIESPSDGCD